MKKNNIMTKYWVWIIWWVWLLMTVVYSFYISQLYYTTYTIQIEEKTQSSSSICTNPTDDQNCMLTSWTGLNNTNSDVQKNILWTSLKLCGIDPMTGFERYGYCKTWPSDPANHIVCAIITDKFLQYTRMQGNDLITPNSRYNFPGLKAWDRWCLCAARWYEAQQAWVVTQIITWATHISILQDVPSSIFWL